MSTQKNITERKRLLIFLNIVISCIASSMLSTALTAALPAIVADLKISVTTGQWLTSGYSLAMGVMMPLTAFLITRFPVVSGGIASFHQWFGCLCYRAEFFCYDAGADFAGWR